MVALPRHAALRVLPRLHWRGPRWGGRQALKGGAVCGAWAAGGARLGPLPVRHPPGWGLQDEKDMYELNECNGSRGCASSYYDRIVLHHNKNTGVHTGPLGRIHSDIPLDGLWKFCAVLVIALQMVELQIGLRCCFLLLLD